MDYSRSQADNPWSRRFELCVSEHTPIPERISNYVTSQRRRHCRGCARIRQRYESPTYPRSGWLSLTYCSLLQLISPGSPRLTSYMTFCRCSLRRDRPRHLPGTRETNCEAVSWKKKMLSNKRDLGSKGSTYSAPHAEMPNASVRSRRSVQFHGICVCTILHHAMS